MKKLGFIVEMKDCKDAADLRRWVDLAQQQGIDGVELLFNSKCGVDFSLDKIKPAFENTPVEPAACGLWWLNTISPDPDERAAVRRTMLEFLDMAEAIGCRMAFFNTGEYDPEDPDKNIAEFKKEYLYYKDIADKKGSKLACYLGHGGNFVHSRGILDKLLKEVPEFNIKLDPVGIMRNMKDDPYEIMKRYANRIAHFHAKDIFRYGDDGWEIEPIVGMGQLKWNVMLGMLWNVGYDGYIIIEPHGDVWAEPENRWKHIVLAKRHLEQYMIR